MATPLPSNRAPFSLVDILRATGGRLRGEVGDAAMHVAGIGTDTRTLVAGQAFVALAGERFDGHAHLADAASRGAVLAIVEREVAAPPGLTVLQVPSTLEALGKLAAAHLDRWRSRERRVVAITGSAGKTTTKRAVTALLEEVQPGAVASAAGNLNNLVGVPMTLLSLEERHRLAVLELGTNAPGEIARLARMVRPDIALVTLVAAAHSAGLGGIEAIAREKGALFRALAPAAVALGNADDGRVMQALASSPADTRLSYGESPRADYRIVRRAPLGLAGAELTIVRRAPLGLAGAELTLVRSGEIGFTLTTPLLGAAGALATAAALAVSELCAGGPLDPERISAALRALASHDDGPGRLAPRDLGAVLVLDDSYNANPASCRASIAAARELAANLGRRFGLVLGEMRELGEASPEAHEALGVQAAESGAAWLVAVGPEAERTARRARELGLDCRHASSAAQAASLTLERVAEGDLVLVKGSRGVGTDAVVRALGETYAPRRRQEAAP